MFKKKEVTTAEVKTEAPSAEAKPAVEKKPRASKAPKAPGSSIYSCTKIAVEELTADGKKPKLEEIAAAVQKKFPEAVPAKVIVMANSCRAAVERAVGRPVQFDKPERKPREKKAAPAAEPKAEEKKA